uniref:Pathogenesis related class 10 protein n=1 Tax=Hypericum tomentosum TaxID=1137039 RepID=A0A1C9KD02_9ROSI|nr:phenolic oxidative coupling protein POCP2 [Hypericum tomentosum]
MSYSVYQDITSQIPPQRLMKALVSERHKVVPKLRPNIFKSMELLHGDGGTGSIRKAEFVDGFPMKYMIHRIDVLDMKNLYCKFTLYEGCVLGDKYEEIEHEIQLEPLGEGCKGKISTHYHPKPGVVVNKEEIDAIKAKAHTVIQDVEKYLLANPDVCAVV